jgi:hypothetical protein
MAKQFKVAEDVSYTCETAAHFWLLHVLSRWEKFSHSVQQRKTPDCVKASADLLHSMSLRVPRSKFNGQMSGRRVCWRSKGPSCRILCPCMLSSCHVSCRGVSATHHALTAGRLACMRKKARRNRC